MEVYTTNYTEEAVYDLEIKVSYVTLPVVSDTKAFKVEVVDYCEPSSITVVAPPPDVDYYIGTSTFMTDNLIDSI